MIIRNILIRHKSICSSIIVWLWTAHILWQSFHWCLLLSFNFVITFILICCHNLSLWLLLSAWWFWWITSLLSYWMFQVLYSIFKFFPFNIRWCGSIHFLNIFSVTFNFTLQLLFFIFLSISHLFVFSILIDLFFIKLWFIFSHSFIMWLTW